MDDERGLFLGMPHGTTPAAVTANKNIIMSSLKSSRYIQKEEGGLFLSSPVGITITILIKVYIKRIIM